MTIASDKTNDTPTRDDHAAHHNALADAVNDLTDSKADADAVVDLSTAQAVGGVKTFSDGVAAPLLVQNADGRLTQLAGIAPSPNRAGALYLYGTNGLGTNGLAWSLGVDTAAATPYRDFFLAKVTSGSTVSDEFYASADNGNGVVAFGIGFVPPPGDAKVSISPADADLTQGGLRIRYNSNASGLPLRVTASANGRIRQAFNTKGGLYIGGDANLQGAASGIQFGAPTQSSGVADRSLWLSAAGILTSDALLELPSASTERVGLKIGTGGEPGYLQSSWDANQGMSLQHNAYYAGTARTWATSHASFGVRAVEMGFGLTDGIRFYADAAASTGGSAATVTERMRIQNNGNVAMGSKFGLSGAWAALTLTAPTTSHYGLIVQAIASQAEPLCEWEDSSGNPYGGIDKSGFWYTNKNAAPADGDLVAGQCVLWFDKTNGAAKLMIKGKSTNGTVVAGSVALS